MTSMPFGPVLLVTSLAAGTVALADEPPDPIPPEARLVLNEDWASGEIDPGRWYVLRVHRLAFPPGEQRRGRRGGVDGAIRSRPQPRIP